MFPTSGECNGVEEKRLTLCLDKGMREVPRVDRFCFSFTSRKQPLWCVIVLLFDSQVGRVLFWCSCTATGTDALRFTR